MATEPNQAFLGQDVKTITLAGKEWPIPILAPRQNRVIVPMLNTLMRTMNDPNFVLDTDTYDRLIDCSWIALTRAHPKITRDELLDMTVTTKELMDAIGTIADQTKLLKKKEAASGEAPEGQSTGIG